MSIDFKLRDYFRPLSILRLRMFLEKSQWYSEEELKDYQMTRLRQIVAHAHKNVPYYRKLFNSIGIKASDIKEPDDLRKIPTLTKELLRKNFQSLQATNIRKYGPRLCRTTGTTGEPTSFYLDKSSNVLEFCYYWRYWSWAGYRLHMPFAEFSIHHFLGTDINRTHELSRATNRLLLNPSQLSLQNLSIYIRALEKHRPLFLKGSPSTLYILSQLMKDKPPENLHLKAIFTTGELVIPLHRETIETSFGCKIIDSYGHMERTVAISQCPHGSYHIHPEYGILEVDEKPDLCIGSKAAGTVIGTSLHNFAMPLIRYEIDDIMELKEHPQTCGCGRKMPIVDKILGRTQHIIVTPDGRYLTNVFVLFSNLLGVKKLQIIQDDLRTLRVRMLRGDGFSPESVDDFMRKLRQLTGQDMDIVIDYSEWPDPAGIRQKYQPIISHVKKDIC
jgi:phenylacetate-CoA ligase